MHYYLIHGIDATRKPFMEDQFRRYGIPADDVTWITYPNKHDAMPDKLSTDPTLSKGLLSCGYKHYLALKDICEKGYEHAVIMEDNIEFRGNVPDAIQRYLKNLPADWDCVFDSDFFGLKYRGQIIDDNPVYKVDLEAYNGGTKGAHFYLITNKFAKKLYHCYLPFNHAPDHHYNGIFKSLNANIFWAEPPNVHKIYRPSTWKDDTPHMPKIAWLKNSQR
jgi:GR25 family glycosyltransferase involved in LPS biosynthesis